MVKTSLYKKIIKEMTLNLDETADLLNLMAAELRQNKLVIGNEMEIVSPDTHVKVGIVSKG